MSACLIRPVRPGDADLPRGAPQSRGGASPSRRHPREQRGDRPRHRLPQIEHFYDQLHARIYETAAKLILSGKRATPITLKTFSRPSPSGELSIPQYLGRPARQRDHHHQRRGLRPHRLRPRHPPPAHPDRRDDGQHRLRLAHRRAARGADRGRRAEALRASRDRQIRLGLRALHRRADPRHRHGGECLSARRRPVRVLPPASPISTARWAACNPPT